MSDKKKSPLNQFIRYSSLGFEMIAVILLCALVGTWMDGKFVTEKAYYTLGWLLFGVFASLYLLFKRLKNM